MFCSTVIIVPQKSSPPVASNQRKLPPDARSPIQLFSFPARVLTQGEYGSLVTPRGHGEAANRAESARFSPAPRSWMATQRQWEWRSVFTLAAKRNEKRCRALRGVEGGEADNADSCPRLLRLLHAWIGEKRGVGNTHSSPLLLRLLHAWIEVVIQRHGTFRLWYEEVSDDDSLALHGVIVACEFWVRASPDRCLPGNYKWKLRDSSCVPSSEGVFNGSWRRSTYCY